MTCQHCGGIPDRWHRALELETGAPSCSYSPAWLAECATRHRRVLRILRLDDREERRDFIARIERTEAESPPLGVTNSAVYAAEVRRRLEAAVLDQWQRSRAARAA